jgi:hypothetical protein
MDYEERFFEVRVKSLIYDMQEASAIFLYDQTKHFQGLTLQRELQEAKNQCENQSNT